MNKNPRNLNQDGIKNRSEASFTLIETIIALGLMVTVIVEVSTIQGNSISFSDYNRNVSQATWLGQAVLEKVDWYKDFYDFKEIQYEQKEIEFSEEYCPKDPRYGECIFKYDLKIVEFPLPVVGLIAGQLGGGGDDDGGGLGSLIENQIKNFLGDEILKLATVEVHWPEGSKRNSVEMSYLIANQKQLDEQIFLQEGLDKPPASSKKTPTTPATPATPTADVDTETGADTGAGVDTDENN